MARRLNYNLFYSNRLIEALKSLDKGSAIKDNGLYFAFAAFLLIFVAVIFFKELILFIAIGALGLGIFSIFSLYKGRIYSQKNNAAFTEALLSNQVLHKTARVLTELPDDCTFFSNIAITLSGQSKLFDFVVFAPQGIFFLICLNAENRCVVEHNSVKCYNNMFPEVPFYTESIWPPDASFEIDASLHKWLSKYGLPENTPVRIVIVVDTPSIQIVSQPGCEVVSLDKLSGNWFKKFPESENLCDESIIRSLYNYTLEKDEHQIPLSVKLRKFHNIPAKEEKEKQSSGNNSRINNDAGLMSHTPARRNPIGDLINNILYALSRIMRFIFRTGIVLTFTAFVIIVLFFAVFYIGVNYYAEQTQQITAYFAEYIPKPWVEKLNIITTEKYTALYVTGRTKADNVPVYSNAHERKDAKYFSLAKNMEVILLSRDINPSKILFFIKVANSPMQTGWVDGNLISYKVTLRKGSKLYWSVPARENEKNFIVNQIPQPVLLIQKNYYPARKQTWYKVSYVGEQSSYWVLNTDLLFH